MSEPVGRCFCGGEIVADYERQWGKCEECGDDTFPLVDPAGDGTLPVDLLGHRGGVFFEIEEERRRQEQAWAYDQPRGPDPIPRGRELQVLGGKFGEVCQAMAEKNRPELRKKLTQVAAVACRLLEHLDNIRWTCPKCGLNEARYDVNVPGFEMCGLCDIIHNDGKGKLIQ